MHAFDAPSRVSLPNRRKSSSGMIKRILSSRSEPQLYHPERFALWGGLPTAPAYGRNCAQIRLALWGGLPTATPMGKIVPQSDSGQVGRPAHNGVRPTTVCCGSRMWASAVFSNYGSIR